MKVSERAGRDRVWQDPILDPVQFPGSSPALATLAVKVVKFQVETQWQATLAKHICQKRLARQRRGLDSTLPLRPTKPF